MPAKVKSKIKIKSKPKQKAKSKPAAKKTIKPKTKARKPVMAKAKKEKTRPKAKPTAKAKVTKKITPIASITKAAIGPISSFGPVGFKPYKLEKNEEYMNEAQLQHFRHILLLWKQQLLAEFDRTKQHMQNDAANYADPLDRATQEEEFNFELRTRDRERKLVKKIEDALERINNNDYGYCTDCGAEIGIRRLEARPTATQCIDCKTFEEIKERQTGTV